MSYPLKTLLALILFSFIYSCSNDDDVQNNNQDPDILLKVKEAESLLNSFRSYGGVPYDKSTSFQFPSEANVYIKSVYGVNYQLRHFQTNPSGPLVTLPLYKGKDSNDNDIEYIITESSDEVVADMLGVAYTPRIANASPEGRQDVEIIDGIIHFKGSVDFSYSRSVDPGVNNDSPLSGFPPASVNAGAIADENWSSFSYLPSGVVLNTQAVYNSTGVHDRIPHHGNIGEDNLNNPYIDLDNRKVTFQLLDGWRGGNRYFYHIVTDTNDMGPAAIELGVYAPRLSNISNYSDYPEGAYLPFSPSSNGPDILGVHNQADQRFSQGLNVAVKYNQEIDPVNVFPFGPDNVNFSPMWDAHVSMWTQESLDNDLIRIIKGTDDLKGLMDQGQVVSFIGNDETVTSSLLEGLSPTGLLINCPVIAQPIESAIGNQYGSVLKP